MVKRGFTLIELLVVVAVILILAGLLLTASNMILSTSKRTRTETIFATVQQGLRLAAAERGSLPAPTEHPMAGSLPPRARFLRPGHSLSASGEALVGVEPAAAIPAVRPRVLAGSDVFADPALPLLYGLERRRIGLLAAGRGDVTRYRWLALPPGESVVPDRDGDGDYTTADYPDRVHLVAPATTAAASAAHLSHFLDGGPMDELRRLGALRDAPVAGDLHGGKLASVPDAATGDRWEPGCVRLIDGTWSPYRLPGASLVDAWGREVLYTLRAGQVALLSAGPDGVMAIDPGPDGSYHAETDPLGGERGGDDRDGAVDNVELGQ